MINQNKEITFTRTLLVPPGSVYQAFTSAEGWCKWCCETAEADARVGGKYHIYTEGYNAYGEYKELEKDKAVIFTWDGDKEPPMIIHVTMSGRDGSTDLTFTVRGLCSEEEWKGIEEFLERTWNRVLDNLKTVLESEPAK